MNIFKCFNVNIILMWVWVNKARHFDFTDKLGIIILWCFQE